MADQDRPEGVSYEDRSHAPLPADLCAQSDEVVDEGGERRTRIQRVGETEAGQVGHDHLTVGDAAGDEVHSMVVAAESMHHQQWTLLRVTRVEPRGCAVRTQPDVGPL